VPPWLSRLLCRAGVLCPSEEDAARHGALIGGPGLEQLKTQGVPRSGRWPAVRRAHLAKHPRCAACGRLSDVEVHHVVPLHVDRSLELAESNLLSLCDNSGRSCHFIFGHLWDWRLYCPEAREVCAKVAQLRLEAAARQSSSS
jgi:hypothetical protein